MRAALENTLNALWYGGRFKLMGTVLRPVAAGLQVLARRNWRAKAALRATPLPVPVVVVGNIVAGGSGKTPVTQALAVALTARGLRVGIVSRGYGGKVRRASLVNPDEPSLYGDEPCLLAATTGCPVAVGHKRRAAVALLCQRFALDVIVSDDGLQHAALHRDFEICVLGPRGLGNGRLLPAGPLREPAARLASVGAVLVWGEPDASVPKRVAQHKIVGAHGGLQMLSGNSAPEASLQALAVLQARSAERQSKPIRQGSPIKVPLHILAAAGLAQPERFYVSLAGAGLQFKTLSVPDHGVISAAQWARIPEQALLLVTEKDAVKLRAANLSAAQQKCIRVVPWRVQLPMALVDAVVSAVVSAVSDAVVSAALKAKPSNLKP